MTPQFQAAIRATNIKRPAAPPDLRKRLYRTACLSSISLATVAIEMRDRWEAIDAARVRADINHRLLAVDVPVSP